MFEFIQEYDVQILQALNSIGNNSIDWFWLFITKIYVWIPFFISFFLVAKKKNPNKNIAAIFIVSLIMLVFLLGLTEGVKIIVYRVRPCNNLLLDGLFREVIHPQDYSFFSGHSAISVALATYFIVLLRKSFKSVYILMLWAVLFLFSRLYFAVHYPSDILVGILVGFITAKLFVKLVRKKIA